MEDRADLARAHARRDERLERVVALVRIERPVLAALHGLVVDHGAGAADDEIDEVEGAAEVRDPREALVGDLRRRVLRRRE